MNMFLLTWNPEKWAWDEMDDEIKKLELNEEVRISWRCRSTTPKNGDMFLIMMLGTDKNGLFCSGTIESLEKNVYTGNKGFNPRLSQLPFHAAYKT